MVVASSVVEQLIVHPENHLRKQALMIQSKESSRPITKHYQLLLYLSVDRGFKVGIHDVELLVL